MFQQAIKNNREAVYGILCHTTRGTDRQAGTASGFMIAPGVIATVAHVLYRNKNEFHDLVEVIRALDVGMNMESAIPVMIDAVRDLALIRVENPRNTKSMPLSRNIISSGTSCGSLGFPLSSVTFHEDNLNVNLTERFQGGFVSAYVSEYTDNELYDWYETDSMMYSGSSGCPVFTPDGIVFGMQAATLIGEDESDGEANRLSIARLVPSTDIISMAQSIGIRL
jgi:S1-C subfamily serine protease